MTLEVQSTSKNVFVKSNCQLPQNAWGLSHNDPVHGQFAIKKLTDTLVINQSTRSHGLVVCKVTH